VLRYWEGYLVLIFNILQICSSDAIACMYEAVSRFIQSEKHLRIFLNKRSRYTLKGAQALVMGMNGNSKLLEFFKVHGA
jgi:hypothetical protein